MFSAQHLFLKIITFGTKGLYFNLIHYFPEYEGTILYLPIPLLDKHVGSFQICFFLYTLKNKCLCFVYLHNVLFQVLHGKVELLHQFM